MAKRKPQDQIERDALHAVISGRSIPAALISGARWLDNRHRHLWRALSDLSAQRVAPTLDNIMQQLSKASARDGMPSRAYVQSIITGEPEPTDLPPLDFEELPF
ncbi:MAG TPA: hypothetical protein VGL38_03935 [bacterium]|jgi:hypothetical protein